MEIIISFFFGLFIIFFIADIITDITALRQQFLLFLPSGLPGLGGAQALPGLFCTAGVVFLGLGGLLPELGPPSGNNLTTESHCNKFKRREVCYCKN